MASSILDLIPIDIVYDVRARNGTWCKLPYPNHPKGCPNFPHCPSNQPNFLLLEYDYDWYAVIEEFDLASHAEEMKRKHPSWTERQCRNVLYWQNSVRKRLKEKTYANQKQNDVVLEIPEASGVNVFATFSKVGIILQRQNPNYVLKTMFIGKPKVLACGT